MSVSRPLRLVDAIAFLLLLLAAMSLTSATHVQPTSALPPSLFHPPRSLTSLVHPQLVHTWHNMTVTSGAWTATLSVLSEGLTFVDRLGATITAFPISPSLPFQYGMVLDDSDDFEVLYQLTLMQLSTSATGLDSSSSPSFPVLSPAVTRKVCLFVIGANSAANPHISAFSYNGGALCTWKINPGVGVDFWAV